jgi:hypothetical protein
MPHPSWPPPSETVGTLLAAALQGSRLLLAAALQGHRLPLAAALHDRPLLVAALSRVPPPLLTTDDLLSSAVTMSADTDAAALRTQLEAIVKEDKDAKEKVVAARCRVQATRLLLEEEETKAAALEQTATAARQRLPYSSSSSSASASQIASPPLRPTKTRLSSAFTFRQPRSSMSANW